MRNQLGEGEGELPPAAAAGVFPRDPEGNSPLRDHLIRSLSLWALKFPTGTLAILSFAVGVRKVDRLWGVEGRRQVRR